MNVFTFWEGKMPAYIELCMRTWKVPHTILNYANLNDFTRLDTKLFKRFTLPQIADIVRAHVLRDCGGYWLDADTIMLSDELPKANMLGDPDTRVNSIGFLRTEKGSDMFVKWAEYQDEVMNADTVEVRWDLLGNKFTDQYVRDHSEIKIDFIRNCFPELRVEGDAPRKQKYCEFYFNRFYDLSDIEDTDLLMLHNSWTPTWYKNLTMNEVLVLERTLSNILREVV